MDKRFSKSTSCENFMRLAQQAQQQREEEKIKRRKYARHHADNDYYNCPPSGHSDLHKKSSQQMNNINMSSSSQPAHSAHMTSVPSPFGFLNYNTSKSSSLPPSVVDSQSSYCSPSSASSGNSIFEGNDRHPHIPHPQSSSLYNGKESSPYGSQSMTPNPNNFQDSHQGNQSLIQNPNNPYQIQNQQYMFFNPMNQLFNFQQQQPNQTESGAPPREIKMHYTKSADGQERFTYTAYSNMNSSHCSKCGSEECSCFKCFKCNRKLIKRPPDSPNVGSPAGSVNGGGQWLLACPECKINYV